MWGQGGWKWLQTLPCTWNGLEVSLSQSRGLILAQGSLQTGAVPGLQHSRSTNNSEEEPALLAPRILGCRTRHPRHKSN